MHRGPFNMIVINAAEDMERLALALELQRMENISSLSLAWARAGELLDELRALVVTWDWSARIAGNPEAW